MYSLQAFSLPSPRPMEAPLTDELDTALLDPSGLLAWLDLSTTQGIPWPLRCPPENCESFASESRTFTLPGLILSMTSMAPPDISHLRTVLLTHGSFLSGPDLLRLLILRYLELAWFTQQRGHGRKCSSSSVSSSSSSLSASSSKSSASSLDQKNEGCEAAQRLRVIQVLKRWMDWCPWEFSPSEAETVEEARISTQLLTVTLLFSHYLLTQPGCTGDHAQALLARCEAKGMMAHEKGGGRGVSVLRSPSIDTIYSLSPSSSPIRPLSGSFPEAEEDAKDSIITHTASLLSTLALKCGERGQQERVLRVRVQVNDLDLLVDSIDPQILGIMALDLLTGQEDEDEDETYSSIFRSGQVLWPEDFTGDGTLDSLQRYHSAISCLSCKSHVERGEGAKEISPCGHEIIHWVKRLLRPIKDSSSISLFLMKCRKRCVHLLVHRIHPENIPQITYPTLYSFPPPKSPVDYRVSTWHVLFFFDSSP